jgi:glutaredoxin-like protein NrdH
MTQEGIAYDEVNVEEDAEALAFVKSLGYESAPVVVAGDQHWSGFRPERIKGLNPRDAA